MARWVPFLALTASVLLLLLGLARLSSGFVRDSDSDTVDSQGRTVADESAIRTESTPGEPTPADRPATATAHPNAESHSPHHIDQTGPDGSRSDAETERRVANQPGDQAEFSTTMLLANVAITQGLFGGILLGGMFIFEIPARAVGVTSDPWVVGVPAVGIGLVFGALLWAANETVATVADAVGAGYDEAVRNMLAPERLRGWAALFGLVLPVIAFVEEFIFRAAVIGATTAGFGISPWLLAAVSSVAFALGHGAQGRVGIVVTGALGFALAAGFVVSGSLLMVVVAHYVVNALEFLVHEGFGVERPRV